MNTKSPVLSSLLLASLVLAGCGKSPEPTAGPAASPAAGKQLTIGFAQEGAEGDWRTANTVSFKAEAERRGINLRFSDGQSKEEVQIAAVKTFIAQHVDAIVIAPVVETGWEPVLKEARDAKIPVILSDRTVEVDDDGLFACFVGSDFKQEGRMVADWLIKHTGGKGRILELLGTPGSAPANDRHSAFADAIKGTGLTIIDSQSGDFKLDGGKQVMEAFLKKYKKGDFDIVYSHNDDMAMGAIQAIEEAGLKPGTDIMIVSIDGLRKALQAIVDGKINCVVECNPLAGPVVFDAVEKVVAGQAVRRMNYNHDELFDATNAKDALPTRQY